MPIKSYNTLFIGKVLQHFPTLPSTNTHAIDLLAKSNPMEGTVISTSHQTAGKGQYDRSWESEAGKNITLSIILHPTFLAVRQQFMLNKAVALGIFDFLQHYLSASKVSIKWPNDLYVNNNKIGGILIQNSLRGTQIKSTIVGIGLNINQVDFHSSIPNPTSFTNITGQSYSLDELYTHLCKTIEFRYLQLKNNNWKTLDKDYLSVLYRFGEYHEFERKNNEKFLGKITGVEEDGRLRIVNHRTGREEVFDLKEVRFLI